MTPNVLTDADYKALKTGLAHVTASLEMLATGQRAGLDLDDEIANMQATQFKIQSILAEFFPNRP